LYGWRARIGVLVPATNATAENDFHKLAKNYEGISVHTSRVVGAPGPLSKKWEEEFAEGCLEAAIKLASVKPDLIAVANTAGTFLNDEETISGTIEKETGIKTITTANSVVNSLRKLNIKKLGVVTPYIPEFNEVLTNYLRRNDFEIIDFQTNNTTDIHTIGRYEPYVAYILAKKIRGDIDGVFISCTDFRAVDVIQIIEDDLKVPVISSNLATFSESLVAIGINKPIDGYGRLMKRR
jgi:maleate cis-trans isomerase